MKKLTEIQKQRLALATCAVAALLGIDVLYQIAAHIGWRFALPSTLAAAATTQPATASQPAASQPAGARPAASQPSATQPSATQPTGAPPQRGAPAEMPPGLPPGMNIVMDRMPPPGGPPGGGGPNPPAPPRPIDPVIKKRNVMVPLRQRGHGFALSGVLGNTALFTTRQGQTITIEAGQAQGDFKVLRIDGFVVTIEHEGKQETMKLFPDLPGGPGPLAPAGRPGPMLPGIPLPPDAGPAVAAAGGATAASGASPTSAAAAKPPISPTSTTSEVTPTTQPKR